MKLAACAPDCQRRSQSPAPIALRRWGEAYALDADGPVLEVRHTDCGAPLRVVVECSAEHSTLTFGT